MSDTPIRILNSETKSVPPDSLTLHKRNVNEGDVGAIIQSFITNGFWGRVVVDARTGEVLVGNHRVIAASQLMMPEIPVEFVTTDSPEHALRILAADNRINRLGRDDESALAELLAELSNSEAGLVGTGYDGDFLDDLINDLAEQGVKVAGVNYDLFEQTQSISKSDKAEKATFGVLVICEGEGDQAEQFQRLKDEGYNCVMQGAKPPGVKR